MGANKSEVHSSSVEVYHRNQPVIIALDVKDKPVVSERIHKSEITRQSMSARPIRL
jgi:hypothetical protein